MHTRRADLLLAITADCPRPELRAATVRAQDDLREADEESLAN